MDLIVFVGKYKINYFNELSINFDGIEIKVLLCVKILGVLFNFMLNMDY